MRIRDALAKDAESIGRLHAQSAAYLRTLGDETIFRFSAESYLRDGFGENPAFWGIVAEDEQGLWGYLLYQFSYDTDRALRILFVLDLLVDETMRGKGLGKLLMDAAAVIAKAKGAEEIQWYIYAPNEAAIAFYQKLGGDFLGSIRVMSKAIAE